MSEYELIERAHKFAIDNGFILSMSKARRVAKKVFKRIEVEEQRKFIGYFETSDDYRSTTNSDPTGEQAVNNILREILSGTPAH